MEDKDEEKEESEEDMEDMDEEKEESVRHDDSDDELFRDVMGSTKNFKNEERVVQKCVAKIVQHDKISM